MEAVVESNYSYELPGYENILISFISSFSTVTLGAHEPLFEFMSDESGTYDLGVCVWLVSDFRGR